VIVFLHLLYTHGAYYFDSIRNWDKEKNKLLEAYGYSLSDPLEGKFEFSYKDGKPFLRVLGSGRKSKRSENWCGIQFQSQSLSWL
jgi:hypothetical protein